MKKDNSDIAPFPPKRVRNSQPKVLEQRRAALELYIQKMLHLLATKQQVLNFLGIEDQGFTSHKRYPFKLNRFIDIRDEHYNYDTKCKLVSAEKYQYTDELGQFSNPEQLHNIKDSYLI